MAGKNPTQDTLNKSMIVNILLVLVVLILSIVLVYQGTGTKAQATTTITQGTNATTTVAQQNGTLAGIDQQLNGSALSVINDAPLSYFEYAGQRLLNSTLTDQIVVANSTQYNALIINGKPSVIYIGATSCIFCGENRWAMALALSRFGNFSALYQGYSSFGDGDVPTLYWTYDNYTTPAGVGYGNHYNSNLITFISADYESPITGGFQVQPLSYFIQQSPNATYSEALNFMNYTSEFQGTPFTFWGTSIVTGADGVVFGNTTPTGTTLPLSQMTHAQVLGQLSSFNDQFAWSEYAAADVYIAKLCPAVNNAAAVCLLPAIKALGSAMGLAS